MFSQFDCCEMFHQIPIDRECAKKILNVHALNTIYTFFRGMQGVKVMPSVAQKIVDVAFESVNHSDGFIDDLTCSSRNEYEHLDCDLPEFLALCSFYNFLLSPKKTDLMRPTTRVLGHQVAEESVSVCEEKRAKIAQLAPPSSAKDVKSKLAFMQYFYQVAPKLNSILSPFRQFAKEVKAFVEAILP